MALLHAKNLYVGNITTLLPATTTVYTVPAGDRIILRSVAVRNNAGSSPLTVYVSIDGVYVWQANLTGNASSGGSAEWRPWVVVGPGSVIRMACNVGPGVGAVVSGSIYTI